MIIADTFEPETIKKIADEVMDLGYDYLVCGDKREYYIERKTIPDMINSIRGGNDKYKGRFFAQLKRLKLCVEESRRRGREAYPILILEGNHFKQFKSRYAHITPNQWFGILSRVAEMEVYVIRTWGIKDTKLLLKILNDRAGKEISDMIGTNINKELRTMRDECMHILMAIKGIGEKTAMDLYRHFGNVYNVLTADKKELMKVVNEKLADHILEVLRYRGEQNELEV